MHCRLGTRRRAALIFSVGAALAHFAGADVHAASSKRAEKAPDVAVKPAAQPPAPVAKGSLAEQYCQSAVDAVREARHAAHVKQLGELRKDIDERLAKADARLAEIKEWIQKRDAFANLASNQLVGIYAAMRPEAASEQLGKMDEITAAAIISRLDARAASAILNDMPAEKAARLATILASASNKSLKGGKS